MGQSHSNKVLWMDWEQFLWKDVARNVIRGRLSFLCMGRIGEFMEIFHQILKYWYKPFSFPSYGTGNAYWLFNLSALRWGYIVLIRIIACSGVCCVFLSTFHHIALSIFDFWYYFSISPSRHFNVFLVEMYGFGRSVRGTSWRYHYAHWHSYPKHVCTWILRALQCRTSWGSRRYCELCATTCAEYHKSYHISLIYLYRRSRLPPFHMPYSVNQTIQRLFPHWKAGVEIWAFQVSHHSVVMYSKMGVI